MKSSHETCLHSLCNNSKMTNDEFFNQTKKRTFKTFLQVIAYVNFYHPAPFWGHQEQLMAEWWVTFDIDCIPCNVSLATVKSQLQKDETLKSHLSPWNPKTTEMVFQGPICLNLVYQKLLHWVIGLVALKYMPSFSRLLQ